MADYQNRISKALEQPITYLGEIDGRDSVKDGDKVYSGDDLAGLA